MSINTLYENAQNGGKAAEEILFKDISERFLRFAHQRIWDEQDALEIVQEALATIAREYKEIEFKTSFSAWAYKVLDYRILSYIKKKQRLGKSEQLFENSPETGTIRPNHDLKIKLLFCLGKINSINRRHARILNLSYQGYIADEICERMALTKNNLYIVLHRARKALEECLKKEGQLK